MLSIDKINSLKYTTSMANCKVCTNNCRLTINKFSGGRQFVSGNRCERGIGKEKNKDHVPNLYEYKYKRIFSYKPLSSDQAVRGQVGIPRVLNMFENYPFWFTFFTKLKYEVVLSPTSTRKIYELGIESIPRNLNVTRQKWPMEHKLASKKGVKFDFLSLCALRRNEFPDAVNHYNCPIVTSYAENIKNNVDELHNPEIDFRNPFLAFTSVGILADRLVEVFQESPSQEVKDAVHAAWEELAAVRKDIETKGEETLAYLKANRTKRYCPCRTPLPTLTRRSIMESRIDLHYGLAVLTEDSVSHLGDRTSHPCQRPMDVPFPALCSGRLCKNKGRS